MIKKIINQKHLLEKVVLSAIIIYSILSIYNSYNKDIPITKQKEVNKTSNLPSVSPTPNNYVRSKLLTNINSQLDIVNKVFSSVNDKSTLLFKFSKHTRNNPDNSLMWINNNENAFIITGNNDVESLKLEVPLENKNSAKLIEQSTILPAIDLISNTLVEDGFEYLPGSSNDNTIIDSPYYRFILGFQKGNIACTISKGYERVTDDELTNLSLFFSCTDNFNYHYTLYNKFFDIPHTKGLIMTGADDVFGDKTYIKTSISNDYTSATTYFKLINGSYKYVYSSPQTDYFCAGVFKYNLRESVYRFCDPIFEQSYISDPDVLSEVEYQEYLNLRQNKCPFLHKYFIELNNSSTKYNVYGYSGNESVCHFLSDLKTGEDIVVEINTITFEDGINEFRTWLNENGLQESKNLRVTYVHLPI